MSDTSEGTKGHPPTLLGWIARVASLLILLALFGVVGWHAVRGDEPIRFETKLADEEQRQDNGRWLVPVEIHNLGSRSAGNVHLTIITGGTEQEVEIPMIGADETVTLTIGSDARADNATHRIMYYEAP